MTIHVDAHHARRDDSVCADAGSTFFHDMIGRYFLPDDADFPTRAPCAICGEIRDTRQASGKQICAARAVLTLKLRHAVRKKSDREPEESDDGKKSNSRAPTRAIASDNTFAIVTQKRGVILSDAAPDTMLPANVRHYTSLDKLSLPKIRRALALAPPEPPFLAIFFTRKGSVPLEITHSPFRIAICGTDSPVIIDRRRILRGADLARDIGKKDFEDAVTLRAGMMKGDAKAEDRYAALLAKNPALREAAPRLPDMGDPEWEYIRDVISCGAAGSERETEIIEFLRG